MKARSLSVATGVAGGLIAATTASADFTGVKVLSKPNPYGIFVCNVYATFNDPTDFVVGVTGTPANPISVAVTGGTFYQNIYGGDKAPVQALINIYPSLAYDTFVTVGLKTSTGDNTFVGPGWPGFGSSALVSNNNYWWIPPGDSQGVPNANGQVLIGQFSTINGTSIQGSFLVSWNDGGGPLVNTPASFIHAIPAPGGLLLLATAATLARRRRRV